MLKQYEAVFIMTPVLSDDQIKETVKKYRTMLTEAGGEIIFEDNWGMRKLAYPIEKKNNGFYYLMEFKVEGSAIAKFEVALRNDERILRFLTVALDKFAIAYNEKKRANAGKPKEKREDIAPVEPADVTEKEI